MSFKPCQISLVQLDEKLLGALEFKVGLMLLEVKHALVAPVVRSFHIRSLRSGHKCAQARV